MATGENKRPYIDREKLQNRFLPGVAEDEAHIQAVMDLIDDVVERGDTHAVGFLNRVMDLSMHPGGAECSAPLSIVRAFDQWEFLEDFEAPPVEKGKRRKRIGKSDFGGGALCDGYFLRNKMDTQRIVRVSDHAYRRMTSAFRDLDLPPEERWMAPKQKKKRKKKKQDKLSAALKNPRQTLEDVINDPQGYEELRKIDAIDQLDEVIQSRIGLLNFIDDSLVDSADPRDHKGVVEEDTSEYLVSLESNHGFMNYFTEERRKGKLPDSIRSFHTQLRDDALSIEPYKVAALFIYYAKNARVDRKAIVGRVEDDLNLLAGLADDHEWVQKYGKVNLVPISDLRNKRAITLLDATRIIECKPEILKIRQGINHQIAGAYAEDIGEVIEKIRPIFMTDKFLWHEEYRQGKGSERTDCCLYSKVLNKNDYWMMKTLLRRTTITSGDMADNFARGYSIREFRSTVEKIVVLGRRLKLAENLAEEKGVSLENVYNVAEDELTKIKAADLRKNVRNRKGDLYLRPEEKFAPIEVVDKDVTMKYTLQDVIEIMELSSKRFGDDYHYSNFVIDHFPRIKRLAEVGLYNEKDVERLSHYFRTFARKRADIAGGEEMKGITGAIEWAKGFIKTHVKPDDEHPLLELSSTLPEVGRRIYDRAKLDALRTAAKFTENFKAAVSGPRALAAHKRRKKTLVELTEQSRIYSGKEVVHPRWGYKKGFEVRAKAIDLSNMKQSLWSSPANYFSPEKVEQQLDDFQRSHDSLEAICIRDPGFREKLERLVARPNFRQECSAKRIDVDIDSLKAMYAIASSDPSRTYLSHGLVKTMGEIYGILDQIEAEQPKIRVDRSVLGRRSVNIYEQHKGKSDVRYDLLIPKGYGKSKTYGHNRFLRELGMDWVKDNEDWSDDGYVIESRTEAQLAEITGRVIEENKKTGSLLRVYIDRVRSD
ncbi:hypothetical protein ACFL3V_03635 [Nanoarchaeota archaeon]